MLLQVARLTTSEGTTTRGLRYEALYGGGKENKRTGAIIVHKLLPEILFSASERGLLVLPPSPCVVCSFRTPLFALFFSACKDNSDCEYIRQPFVARCLACLFIASASPF